MIDLSQFHCSFIEREKIDQIADDFFQKYWAKNELPVDVELIIEKLGLEIIPIEYLDKIDAYLDIQMKSIIIKNEWYKDERYENRLRFTFAHELGHYVLHKNIIEKMNFKSLEEYLYFTDNLPNEEHGSFEYQANEFAGRLLVPYAQLKTEVEQIHRILEKENLLNMLKKDPDQMLSAVSPKLCKPFGVSEDAIEIRVKRENLWPPGV